MTHDTPPRIRCRPIGDADIEGLIELLSKGFPNRTRGYWARAMQQLAKREIPAPYPRFGYVLELDGTQIGVILLIFSTQNGRDKAHIRCNISSWYVDPRYRAYASLLIAAAVRQRTSPMLTSRPPFIPGRSSKRRALRAIVLEKLWPFPH